ncbi:PaaX family transcriptional regulator C-terminal domain-containing protein [uncultured Roseobacter sp.]|uniref:PaaX family transcriptional regulator C-terminal domain-containing protein n=1 Tax=uncultured Roseobacter sp. TaxID=114847 RepID=UPI00262A794C|nr:PaaX family transcriptional regulator C-terminal domain-containing protein [uncultured Roseobacter sp.]
MPSEGLRDLTAKLTELGGQRVWSLLISVFGDLAQEEDAGINGPVLSEIVAAMNVRPEATRVALHRLRNDGWITSQKSGRTSQHSLTDHGRRETLTAAKRIYAHPDDMPTDWQIVILDGTDTDQRGQMMAKGYTPLLPRVMIGAAALAVPGDALCLRGETIPKWLRVQLTPDGLWQDYRDLYRILTETDQLLPDGTVLTPLQVAVLRCLIVHNWRRLVLKHPDLPTALYTDGWRENDCRKLVGTLLHRFPRPKLTELSN